MPLGSHQGAPTSVTRCLRDAFPEAPGAQGKGQGQGWRALEGFAIMLTPSEPLRGEQASFYFEI